MAKSKTDAKADWVIEESKRIYERALASAPAENVPFLSPWETEAVLTAVAIVGLKMFVAGQDAMLTEVRRINKQAFLRRVSAQRKKR